jgi:predicted O-methyltransferase YrrM
LVFESSTRAPFLYGATSIRPTQVREEITGLLKILKAKRPKFILEIGTAGGGTLFLFTRVAASDATLVSVDLPMGYSELRIPYYESFSLPDQRIHLIRMDSHKKTTFNAINRILREHKLDFLFIDGDHTYEGVKNDFKMYSKLLNPSGIIAFHDIVPGPPENVGGVPKFWEETKCNFSYIELVKNWKQRGYGIGIILRAEDGQ